MLARRPEIMTMLALLLITPLLLGLSLGQDTSNVTCDPTQQCPENQCCNKLGFCGTTEGFCSQDNCSTQCPSEDKRCGTNYNNRLCLDGQCCSIFSWCGGGIPYCGVGNCASQCPNGTCGSNGRTCPSPSCCSSGGFCGVTAAYCGLGNCVSQCPPPPPSAAPTPTLGGLVSTLAPTHGGLQSTSVPTPGSLRSPAGGQLLLRSKSGGNKIDIIVGIFVGVVAFFMACIVIGFFVRRYRRGGQRGRAFTEEDSMMQLEGMPERFSYKQLSVATSAFGEQSKLGQGGFGSVYRGVLPSSGIPVAVKKINSDSSQGEKEFMAEVSIINRLRHRNLIQLQGWCKDVAREKYLLVYELMPNGSLDKVLFELAEGQTTSLSWTQRLNIVKGTAAAVDYLYQGWKQQVIHRDIKSSNIMLDENWNAKLGDFGLARLVDHQRAGATTVVAGTYGYIAPKAAYSGRFTDKTHVFAFGAVVLEIACGRQAFSPHFPPEEVVLVDWVWERLSEGDLLSTVDKQLEEYDAHLMEVMLVVGLLCSHPDPLARPSMRHVLQVLAGDVPVPRIPTSKPTPVYNSEFGIVGIDYLRGLKSGTSSKSGCSTKSGSGSISLVPSTSDSTRGTIAKSFGSSSNSNPSFREQIRSGDGLVTGA